MSNSDSGDASSDSDSTHAKPQWRPNLLRSRIPRERHPVISISPGGYSETVYREDPLYVGLKAMKFIADNINWISTGYWILARRRCPKPSIVPPAMAVRVPVPYPRSVPPHRPLLILPPQEKEKISVRIVSKVGKIIAGMLRKLSELGLDSAIIPIVHLGLVFYVLYCAYQYTPPTPELDQFVNAFFNNSDDLARLVGMIGGGPEVRLEFLKKLLIAAFDTKCGDEEIKSVLLSALGCLEVFSAQDIVNAFVSLLGDETFASKVPAAFFLSRLVVEDVLAAANLDDILKRLALNPSGVEIVQMSVSLVSLHSSSQVVWLADQNQRRYEKDAVPIIHSYLLSGDTAGVIKRLKEFALLDHIPIFLKKLLEAALDGKNQEKEKASKLLSALHLENFKTEDIVKGFELVLKSPEVEKLDILDATHEIAIFLARAIIDDVLRRFTVEEIRGKLQTVSGEEDHALKVANESLNLAESLVLARNAKDLLLECWK